MVDDTLYITPHETALAVVATAMKKARLRWDVLFVDSIMGAILFSSGGMLYTMFEAECSGLINRDMTGLVSLLQGAVYALGLFFVITTGMELFNSNVLFFSVGILRGAVTFLDLTISWVVSFWVNLAATVLVVYVIGILGGVMNTSEYIEGSLRIAQHKVQASFVETFLRGIAGNFCVCLATYLQMMVKPPHVKFLMVFLPIFTFVAMGFTHVVADMFLVPTGLFNHCGYGWGRYFWKIMLPGCLGNIVGGFFFSLTIPWYLHLVVVEQDMKRLNLPSYEEKDEQPMLNMDSRVIRIKPPSDIIVDNASSSTMGEYNREKMDNVSLTASFSGEHYRPSISSASITSKKKKKNARSPKGVFPVDGMGPALKRERTIAYGESSQPDSSDEDSGDESDVVEDIEESKMSTNLMRVITRAKTNIEPDIEEVIGDSNHGSSVSSSTRRLSGDSRRSSGSRRTSVTSIKNFIARARASRRPSALVEQMNRARTPCGAFKNADSIAGGSDDVHHAAATAIRRQGSETTTNSTMSPASTDNSGSVTNSNSVQTLNTDAYIPTSTAVEDTQSVGEASLTSIDSEQAVY